MDIEELKDVCEELKSALEKRNEDRVPNFFEICRIETKEERISAFLSWLLNPRENHGLDSAFLNRVLTRIDVAQIDSEEWVTVKTEVSRIAGDKERRFDLLISLPESRVGVEKSRC
ncbi:MAG: hypothetical protein MAG715_00808 [Methanonatronarchaeales archaeon]|nr:hypothetical protein [Methanonatronarchaeales archaeon]